MNSYASRSSSETFDFTDEEIRHELTKLGYNDIREDQFEEFKRGSLLSFPCFLAAV